MRRPLLVMCVLACPWLTTAPAGAVEAQTHLFDATLSLVGSCETFPSDPTPDPGCPAEPQPPAGRFNVPFDVATDQHGDIYIVSRPLLVENKGAESGGVIDIFNPNGEFLTELPDNHLPQAIAVDTEGNMYVYRAHGESGSEEVVRYDPETYEPVSGEISYPSTPTSVVKVGGLNPNMGIAVDTSKDAGYANRLYLDEGDQISEYGAASEGNPLIESEIERTHERFNPETQKVEIITQGLFDSHAIAVDPVTHAIYASDTSSSNIASPSVVRVYSGTTSGHPLLRTIAGDADTGPACPPSNHFSGDQGLISVAVEPATGHVFVYDPTGSGPRAVYEFNETGTECIARYERKFVGYAFQMGLDTSPTSPNEGYFYVPSGGSQTEAHVWAFKPFKAAEPPSVEAVSAANVTAAGGEVRAKVDPEGATTHYRLEYQTQTNFEAEGFSGAAVAGEGTIAAGSLGVAVSATLNELAPGTKYRVRVIAENECQTVPNPQTECVGEGQGSFTTSPSPEPFGACPNDRLREQLGSILLPDCRAYELVTPGDTGGHLPFDTQTGEGNQHFSTPTVSADGRVVAFITKTGALSGTGAAGSLGGSLYLSSRDPDSGWKTESAGPTGEQATIPDVSGLATDFSASIFSMQGHGSMALASEGGTVYVRHADGSYSLVGEGSEGVDIEPKVAFVSPGATHAIFESDQRLEPEAPPAEANRAVVYDRTPEGLQVASLLPGDAILPPGIAANYKGASADGNVVAFEAHQAGEHGPLYLRIDDETTQEMAPAGAVFAGLSADGQYAFFARGEGIFRYDTRSGTAVEMASGVGATVINVPTSGEALYFVSQSDLSNGRSNPEGAMPRVGEENLYVWREGTIRFIGTVTTRDVTGTTTGASGFQYDGLGLWDESLLDGSASDPSRTTPSGSALLFQSRALLTSYDSRGKTEIYRFDAQASTLTCISCSPSEASAESDASLLSLTPNLFSSIPTSRWALVDNLSDDGSRAFFQTADALVPTDTDGVQDVYEWEAPGVGTCRTEGGCLYLITSGASAKANYLYGVSADGGDVFFATTDRLLESDADGTPSIYDARVGGGFAEPSVGGCEGEECRPTLTAPPSLLTPASSAVGPPFGSPVGANPHPCPKGEPRRRIKGKLACVHARAKKTRKTKKKRRARSHKKHRSHGKKGGSRK